MFGRIAQLVEQKTLNLLVGGSSPPAPTFQVTRSLVDFLLGPTLAITPILCYNTW